MNTSAHIETKDGCIKAAMQIIGNKWTALILRDLVQAPQRFSALSTSCGVNPRTLSQRLDALEAHGIIEQRSETAGGHAAYQLTAKGRDLIPVLEQMAAWGNKYYTAPQQ